MASQFPPKKNAAFTLFFTLYKNDGSVIANPGTITKKISKDGGAVADITASVTEIDTTYGMCSLVISSTEMNADAISIYVIDNTSGCVPFTVTLYTAGSLFDELKTETAAILTDTAVIGAAGAGLTAVPWNASWDAEVQSECTDALNAYDPPTNAEMVARTIAAADYATAANLATVDTVVDAIKLKTDNIPAAPATEAKQDTIIGYIDTEVAAILAAVDTEVAAIKAKTDNLPASPANEATLTTIAGYIDTEVAAILADTNELQTDLTNGGRLDLLIDAIKAKTDVIPASPAAVGSEMTLTVAYDAAKTAASQASVDVIDGIVDDILVDTETTLDTLIKDIPTNAELEARTLATADYATAANQSTIIGYIDTEVAAIKAKTDNLPASPAAVGSEMILTAAYDAAKTAATQASVDAIGVVTGKIDTALVLDGAEYQFTANALELLPSGVDVTPVTEALDALTEALDIPANGRIWVYTCTDSTNGYGIQGVKVVISTDNAGQNCIAEAYTNGLGQAQFYLSPGTYYVWRFKTGFNATNPDVEVVT